jgi:hypothetical protein
LTHWEDLKQIPDRIDRNSVMLDKLTTTVERIEHRLDVFKKQKILHPRKQPVSIGILYKNDTFHYLPIFQAMAVWRPHGKFLGEKIYGSYEEARQDLEGRYILIESKHHGLRVIITLMITMVSNNKADQSKKVDLFINDKAAKLLSANLISGRINVACHLLERE